MTSERGHSEGISGLEANLQPSRRQETLRHSPLNRPCPCVRLSQTGQAALSFPEIPVLRRWICEAGSTSRMPLGRQFLTDGPDPPSAHDFGSKGNRADLQTQQRWFFPHQAGLSAPRKPFHNLRSSCVTDWSETLPSHAVCDFAGHTEAVSMLHYRQTHEEYFQRLSKPTNSAAQNPAQYTSEPGGMAGKRNSGTPGFPEDSAVFRSITGKSHTPLDSNASTQQTDPSTGYDSGSGASGAESGAVAARDAALRLLVDVWHELPDETVNAVLRLVQAAAANGRAAR